MLAFCRLTGFGMQDVLAMTWNEFLEWMDDAVRLEEEISARKQA